MREADVRFVSIGWRVGASVIRALTDATAPGREAVVS
jgi:hypothetical protein